MLNIVGRATSMRKLCILEEKENVFWIRSSDVIIEDMILKMSGKNLGKNE